MGFRLLPLLACLGAVACAAPRPASFEEQEIEWVSSVLLGSEAGDARTSLVRWAQSVSYLVVGAAARHRRQTDRAFSQLRAALAGVHQLTLSYVEADDARLGRDGHVAMFFTAPRAAGQLVERYRALPPDDGCDGWFTLTWNNRFEVTRAVIFVDPDLGDRWLGHTVLEEMVQVLGLSNDSPLRADSIVFEGVGVAGSRCSLAERDRQLLRLLYGELSPGQSMADVAQAMRCHWNLVAP